MTEHRTFTEEGRIVLGFWPRTAKGWWFWLRYWSPPALWLTRAGIAVRHGYHKFRGSSRGYVDLVRKSGPSRPPK